MRQETWKDIDRALKLGLRGLPGGSSLNDLLVRNGRIKPQDFLDLNLLKQDLSDFNKRTGRWPTASSSIIAKRHGVKWKKIELLLKKYNICGGRRTTSRIRTFAKRELGAVVAPSKKPIGRPPTKITYRNLVSLIRDGKMSREWRRKGQPVSRPWQKRIAEFLYMRLRNDWPYEVRENLSELTIRVNRAMINGFWNEADESHIAKALGEPTGKSRVSLKNWWKSWRGPKISRHKFRNKGELVRRRTRSARTNLVSPQERFILLSPT